MLSLTPKANFHARFTWDMIVIGDTNFFDMRIFQLLRKNIWKPFSTFKSSSYGVVDLVMAVEWPVLLLHASPAVPHEVTVVLHGQGCASQRDKRQFQAHIDCDADGLLGKTYRPKIGLTSWATWRAVQKRFLQRAYMSTGHGRQLTVLHVSRADSAVVSTPTEQATSMRSCRDNVFAAKLKKAESDNENTRRIHRPLRHHAKLAGSNWTNFQTESQGLYLGLRRPW